MCALGGSDWLLIACLEAGLNRGQGGTKVLELLETMNGYRSIDWLNVVGSDFDLASLETELGLASVRHLHLTGIPMSAQLKFNYADRNANSGFGFGPYPIESPAPSLNLTSLTLTNVGLRTGDDFGIMGGRTGQDNGLPGEAMAWLLRAASGGDTDPGRDDTPTPLPGPRNLGLRQLRYRLNDSRSSNDYRLSPAALAAIPAGAPALEVCELWLKPENVPADLPGVFGLLDMPSLVRLEVGVFVAHVRFRRDQDVLKEALRTELAKAASELDGGQRAKLILLD